MSALRILLVDDDPDDVRFLRALLAQVPDVKCELRFASRIAEARAELGRPCDVVLLDLSLPDSQGMDTLRAVREAAPGVATIVLTGISHGDAAVEALRSGAQDYLVKGQIDGPSLGRALRYAVERCRLAQERRAAEDELRALYHQATAATQAREEVLSIVAHDLRSPLSAISMTAWLLLETPVSPAEVAEHLQVVVKATARMDRLIRDLLDVACIDAGTLAVDAKPISALPLIHEAWTQMTPAAREREITLEAEIQPGLPAIQADRHRILQVLSNLISNAIRHTPTGGSVTIGAQQLGDAVIVSVTDNGDGIEAEHLAHLFDRFWQAHPTRRRGVGLGLSIARGIIEAHGGRIWAVSERGHGAKFHFTLPVARDLFSPPRDRGADAAIPA